MEYKMNISMDFNKIMADRGNPENLPPLNIFTSIYLYNHRYIPLPRGWFNDCVDTVVLYFSQRNKDRSDKIMLKFYEIYENARFKNTPIEVINVPLDDNQRDMCTSYDHQANWYTLMYGDPLILYLKYLYDITRVPHLVVLRTDGSIVSTDGIADLDTHGANAIGAWMSIDAAAIKCNQLRKISRMHSNNWMYLTECGGKDEKAVYFRKFSVAPALHPVMTSLGRSIQKLRSNWRSMILGNSS